MRGIIRRTGVSQTGIGRNYGGRRYDHLTSTVNVDSPSQRLFVKLSVRTAESQSWGGHNNE